MNDIKLLPFEKLAKHNTTVADCTAFAEDHSLKSRTLWFPAQLMAVIANWKPLLDKVNSLEGGLPFPSNESQLTLFGDDSEGTKFSTRRTLEAALKDDWTRGAYMFMMHARRSDYLGIQYKEPGTSYCALVPFILAGFKIYHNVEYDQWTSYAHLLESNLQQVLDYAKHNVAPPEDEVLELRQQGLAVMTGKTAGSLRNPVSTHALYGIAGTTLGKLPWLAQVMVAQIWCAHPENRNSNMILDPWNITKTPKPLIGGI